MFWQVEWASKNRFPPFHSTIIGVECLFEFKSLLTCCFTPFKRFLGGPLKFAFSGGLVGFEEANCAVFAKKRIAHYFSMKFRARPIAGSCFSAVTVKSVALRSQPVDAIPVWKACLNNSIGTLAPVRHLPTPAFAKTPSWGIGLGTSSLTSKFIYGDLRMYPTFPRSKIPHRHSFDTQPPRDSTLVVFPEPRSKVYLS